MIVVLGSLLFGTALAISSVLPLATLSSLALLLAFIHVLNTSELSGKTRFVGGFSLGIAQTACTYIWFWDTWPLSWAGVNDPLLAALLIAIGWLYVATAGGISYGFSAVILPRQLVGFLPSLVFASAWTLADFGRAYAISIATAGPATDIAPDWTMGALGYAGASNALLLPLARFGGVFLLSFVIAVSAVTLYTFFTSWRKQACQIQFLSVVALILIGSEYSTLYVRGESEGMLEVAALHTSFGSNPESGIARRIEQFETYKQFFAALETLPAPPDLVVLPEEASYFHLAKTFKDDPWSNSKYLQNTILLDSRSYRKKDHSRESSFISGPEEISSHSDLGKQFLIPAGEYMPNILRYGAKLLGLEDWFSAMTLARNRVPAERNNPRTIGNALVAARFCGEIMTSRLYQHSVQNGATVLVNAASHGLFGENWLLKRHIFQLASLRAVELNRYFVHAGNVMPSFIVTNDGHITDISASAPSFIRATVPQYSKQTPFSAFGNWVVSVSIGILFLWYSHILVLCISKIVWKKSVNASMQALKANSLHGSPNSKWVFHT